MQQQNRFSWMWASAFILAGLCLFQLSRLAGWTHSGAADAANLVLAAEPLFGDATRARGGMVSTVGAYSVLAASVDNEDFVFVLDSRSEQIMVYRVDNMQAVTLKDRQNLPGLFAAARARSQGRGNP
jgi:hypothetical protein